jgi:hypothetical protein
MPTTTDTRDLPAPSRAHATCAWCGAAYRTIVELIDHVDVGHVAPPANALIA